jgi:hypothetical protein
MSLELTPDAYVDIGDDQVFCQAQASATIVGWMLLDALTDRALLSISINNGGIGDNRSRISLEMDIGGQLILYTRPIDGGAFTSLVTVAFPFSTGVRYHVAGVVDLANDFMAIYIDGVLVVSSTPAFTPTAWPNTTADSNAFGAFDKGDGNFVDGQMEDWRLYHRRLDPKEITSIHGSDGPDTIRDTMHFRYLFDDPKPGPETLGTAAAADEIGTAALDQIGIAGAGVVCEVSDNKYVSTGIEPTGTLEYAPKLTRSLRRPA